MVLGSRQGLSTSCAGHWLTASVFNRLLRAYSIRSDQLNLRPTHSSSVVGGGGCSKALEGNGGEQDLTLAHFRHLRIAQL
jgi:hypothetical protein